MSHLREWVRHRISPAAGRSRSDHIGLIVDVEPASLDAATLRQDGSTEPPVGAEAVYRPRPGELLHHPVLEYLGVAVGLVATPRRGRTCWRRARSYSSSTRNTSAGMVVAVLTSTTTASGGGVAAQQHVGQ